MHIFFYIESQSHSISLIHSDPRNIEIKVTSNSTHCHIIYEASLFHFLFWTEISKFQMWPGISPQHFLLLLLLCLNPGTAPGIPSCENSLLPLLAIQVQLWPKVRLNVVIIMELVIFPQVAFFLSSWFSLLSLLSSWCSPCIELSLRTKPDTHSSRHPDPAQGWLLIRLSATRTHRIYSYSKSRIMGRLYVTGSILCTRQIMINSVQKYNNCYGVRWVQDVLGEPLGKWYNCLITIVYTWN